LFFFFFFIKSKFKSDTKVHNYSKKNNPRFDVSQKVVEWKMVNKKQREKEERKEISRREKETAKEKRREKHGVLRKTVEDFNK
jgi:hypothetical protein